jgi:hypothetical protein
MNQVLMPHESVHIIKGKKYTKQGEGKAPMFKRSLKNRAERTWLGIQVHTNNQEICNRVHAGI